MILTLNTREAAGRDALAQMTPVATIGDLLSSEQKFRQLRQCELAELVGDMDGRGHPTILSRHGYPHGESSI